VLSDIHSSENLFQWLPQLLKKTDMILILGDISHWGDQNFYIRFFNYLEKLNVLVLYIPGNHDPILNLNFSNIICIHGKYFELGNYQFFGVGGSNITPFKSPYELPDHEVIKILNSIQIIPDFIISHAPPYNTKCDLTYTGEHVGSRPIKDWIQKNNPKFVLTGHIHESRGIDIIGKTVILNPGPANKNYYATIIIKPRINIELHRA
jgi:Icc-related predicted phosphoesterase